MTFANAHSKKPNTIRECRIQILKIMNFEVSILGSNETLYTSEPRNKNTSVYVPEPR